MMSGVKVAGQRRAISRPFSGYKTPLIFSLCFLNLVQSISKGLIGASFIVYLAEHLILNNFSIYELLAAWLMEAVSRDDAAPLLDARRGHTDGKGGAGEWVKEKENRRQSPPASPPAGSTPAGPCCCWWGSRCGWDPWWRPGGAAPGVCPPGGAGPARRAAAGGRAGGCCCA